MSEKKKKKSSRLFIRVHFLPVGSCSRIDFNRIGGIWSHFW